jgi:hypothetical protein
MDEARLRTFQALRPRPRSGSSLEEAEVVALRSLPPQFVLRVCGTKPSTNTHVELVPLV